MSYWTNKRVVVTGGTGFLGTHLLEKLNAAGCGSVFVVRSGDYDLTTEEGVTRLFGDLAGGKGEARAWPKGGSSVADIVIHLAGHVGGIAANKARPADFFYRNIMMGVLMMHNAWKGGVGKFVAAGAGCGYPESAPLPLSEDSFWNGYPQAESAPYSLAKRMLHVQSVAYWQQHKFPAIVSIPGNIYGPYDNFDLENAHVVPALVRKFVEAADDGVSEVVVWGTGRATRDFVYAGDVAEGILLSAEKFSEPRLVNLSSGEEASVRQIVDLLTQMTGFQGEVNWETSRPDGQARRCFDVTRAKTELGWTARTPLAEGLRKTVDWYRENRGTARNTG